MIHTRLMLPSERTQACVRLNRTSFASADCIALCCGLTPENYHLINANTLSTMKDGVWLVNVARGALIDENALLDALEDGREAVSRVNQMSLDILVRELRRTP